MWTRRRQKIRRSTTAAPGRLSKPGLFGERTEKKKEKVYREKKRLGGPLRRRKCNVYTSFTGDEWWR